MTAIVSNRFNGERKEAADKEGPEKYAPPRRAPDKLADVDRAVSAFEGEIREFVRRDGGQAEQSGQTNQTETSSQPGHALRIQRDDPMRDAPAENLNALIQRVSGASVEEIERVIGELQSVRNMLKKEGERVSREVAGYASLSHAAMTAMKVIGDSLTQWKSAPGGHHGPRND